MAMTSKKRTVSREEIDELLIRHDGSRPTHYGAHSGYMKSDEERLDGTFMRLSVLKWLPINHAEGSTVASNNERKEYVVRRRRDGVKYRFHFHNIVSAWCFWKDFQVLCWEPLEAAGRVDNTSTIGDAVAARSADLAIVGHIYSADKPYGLEAAAVAGVDIQDIVSPDSGELEATQAVLAAQIVSNSDEHLCSVATGATGFDQPEAAADGSVTLEEGRRECNCDCETAKMSGLSLAASCRPYGDAYRAFAADGDVVPSRSGTPNCFDQAGNDPQTVPYNSMATVTSSQSPARTLPLTSKSLCGAPVLDHGGDISRSPPYLATSFQDPVSSSRRYSNVVLPDDLYPSTTSTHNVCDPHAYLPDQSTGGQASSLNPATATSSSPAPYQSGNISSAMAFVGCKKLGEGSSTSDTIARNAATASGSVGTKEFGTPAVGGLSAATEAAMTGRWLGCEQARTAAAAAAAAAALAPPPNVIKVNQAACTAPTIAEARELASQHVCAELVRELAAVAHISVLPDKLVHKEELFSGCQLGLRDQCSHPVMQTTQSSNNSLFVDSMLDSGGFGRICAVKSNGKVDSRYVVKICCGADGCFADHEAINELYYLIQHQGNKGIVQLMGAGFLLPGSNSDSDLRDAVTVRPVLFMLLERMERNLAQLTQAMSPLPVQDGLHALDRLLYTIRQLHSQPVHVHAHRDIKSHNILVSRCAVSSNPTIHRYRICTADLGSMCSYIRGNTQKLSGLYGTMEYMAPELLQQDDLEKLAEKAYKWGLPVGNPGQLYAGFSYDETVDIFSAMMTFIDMLSGLSCAGKQLFARSMREGAENRYYVPYQLQRLLEGKVELGFITQQTFEYYRPVLARLIPMMSGCNGQPRCSANTLLTTVRDLIAEYDLKYPTIARKLEFCI